jgi:hypothetical protein
MSRKVKIKEDLTGRQFGRLTVLERADDYCTPNSRPRSAWKCKCECGNIVNVVTSKLNNGHTKSCHRCNTYIDCGTYSKLILRDKTEVLIDTEDVERLRKYCWYKMSTGYIGRREGKKIVLMHRTLLSPISGQCIDHINGIRTDNRKSNLRACTYSQNNMNLAIRNNNKSGVKGVSFNRFNNKWVAQIGVNHNNIRLGEFKKFEDAVEARKKAELVYFKEYSALRRNDE